MTGPVVDLDAVRELRRAVAGLGDGSDVERVRAVWVAAWRAGDRRWTAWAAERFDEAHDRACGCRGRSA